MTDCKCGGVEINPCKCGRYPIINAGGWAVCGNTNCDNYNKPYSKVDWNAHTHPPGQPAEQALKEN